MEEKKRKEEEEEEKRRREEEKRRKEEEDARARKEKKNKKEGNERKPSSSSSESGDDGPIDTSDDDSWKLAGGKKKKKGRKNETEENITSSSSEATTTTSESEDETPKKGKRRRRRRSKKTVRQLRHETLIRQRMVEARPKTEGDKFGGDDKINYQNFKMRFGAVTDVDGANPLDVLNELTHWLKGAPLKLANAHIGSKEPKRAIREIWGQLDLYYAAQIQTAAERVRPILSKGRIQKEDIDGLIELMSELLAIKTHLKSEGMEADLDRQDIIRDIINKRLHFMSEEFYKAEVKKQKKETKI